LAARWKNQDYFGALAVGWVAALGLTFYRRRRLETVPRTFERAAALAVYAAAVGRVVIDREAYQPLDRAVPLVLGLALMTAAFGLRSWRRYLRQLGMLSVTLVCPLPGALQAVVPAGRVVGALLVPVVVGLCLLPRGRRPAPAVAAEPAQLRRDADR
jgi:hypothetical protein